MTGKELKEKRLFHGYGLRKFASKIGIKPSLLCHYEHERLPIPSEFEGKVAEFFDNHINKLLEDEDPWDFCNPPEDYFDDGYGLERRE
jgi:hypothetical protein